MLIVLTESRVLQTIAQDDATACRQAVHGYVQTVLGLDHVFCPR